jgi:histone-lysine N-methyltransferase SUV420H
LRKTVIINKDPGHAVKQLLQLPGLRKFSASLKDEREKEQFHRHLLRYVKIYMPDCPFEVTTTNRYTIGEHEASVTARKEIKAREEIKYLTGVQVAMTEEQEKTLELARKDFSLVISSRKKTRSLFLGPARFANHDCDANARLSTKGYDGMQIVAVKPIEVGEEITVSYGEDYFGEDNEECLCQSCEDRQVNGWAPFKPERKDDEDEEDEDEEMDEEKKLEIKLQLPQQIKQETDAASRPGKRKYEIEADSGPIDGSAASPPAKKIKTEHEEGKKPYALKTPPASPSKRRFLKPLRETMLNKTYSTSSLRNNVVSSVEDLSTDVTSSPEMSRDIRTQQRDGLLTVTLDETTPSSRATTPHSATAGSPQSALSTDATSVDEDIAMGGQDEKTTSLNPSLGVATVRFEEKKVRTMLPVSTPAKATRSRTQSLREEVSSSSDLSELASDYELDDKLQEVVKRKRKRTKTPPPTRTTRSHARYIDKNRLGTPINTDPTDSGLVENPRKPADYVHSDALLSAGKFSRWVECHNCDDFFVQVHGNQTKKDCPRCERHSMLYGYAWPKTDKEGKHDKEERVLDPRTIHRFVDREEERKIRRERPLLKERIGERYSTPRSEARESTSSTLDVESRGNRRRTRRLRKTM